MAIRFLLLGYASGVKLSAVSWLATEDEMEEWRVWRCDAKLAVEPRWE